MLKNKHKGIDKNIKIKRPVRWPVHKIVRKGRVTLTPNRRFELDVDAATEQNLGNGFFRYLWAPTRVLINPNEIVDFRLNARANQQVISAGHATDPLEDIYTLQMFPRFPNVMAVLLRSSTLSSTRSRIHLWLVVKQR